MLRLSRYLRSGGVAALLGIALAGCGLISTDVTNFDLTLPEKRFTIEASRWDVDQGEANRFLDMTCGNTQACQAAVQTVCPTTCSGMCNQSSKCELGLNISLSQEVNLVDERPELRTLNDEPIIKVTIDSVTYEVTSNSLNIDTPELTVLVAPASVVTSMDVAAKAIGTIAPVPAGTTASAQALTFTPTGRADLVAIMNTFKTPFNVLIGSSILIRTGDPVPSGKLDAVVRIKGHAGL